MFSATYFSDEITTDRDAWHHRALEHTLGTDAVFLDPDNGLETYNMYRAGKATEKHVKWTELNDYYQRGQNVILYQHRPQMTKKEKCIEDIIFFQNDYLKADAVLLLEYPKYTNRFYFMFLHNEYLDRFANICDLIVWNWGKDDFCKKIII